MNVCIHKCTYIRAYTHGIPTYINVKTVKHICIYTYNKCKGRKELKMVINKITRYLYDVTITDKSGTKLNQNKLRSNLTKNVNFYSIAKVKQ